MKQHEETPRDAIRPARCVNVRDAAACKLDQDANAKAAAAKENSRKSEESASEDETIRKQTEQRMHQKQKMIKEARTYTADS